MTPQIFLLLVALSIALTAVLNFVDYFFDKSEKNKVVKK